MKIPPELADPCQAWERSGCTAVLIGSAAMTLSSVFVVWNSLRLGRFRVRAAAPRRRAASLQPGQTA
jgi:hypothetical protein